MTKKGVLQGSEQSETLFVQRGQVRAKTAKDLGSPRCTEAARDLLLHFKHPKVALGLGMVERDTEILKEGQHGLLVHRETIEQIARRRLFASTFFRDLGRRIRWIGLIAGLEHGLIACPPV